MSGRMMRYLEAEAKRFPGREPWPFRLTPGQWDELLAEIGLLGGPPRQPSIQVLDRWHPVERVTLETRPTGDNVILMGRDDLFLSTEDGQASGVQVFHANSVTSIPDNIGCCEVIGVGELVTNVKSGDVCYIDFFEVKQPYVVQTEELYIAGADAFRAKFDPKTGLVVPLENMIITKPAPDRFKVAMNGTDRVHMLPSQLTSGIAGGKNSSGGTSSHILYHEIVAVGPLTKRPRPSVMTKLEREILDAMANTPDQFEADAGYWVRKLEVERAYGRKADITAGELVMFCEELGTKIRVRGEHQYMVPYDNVLAVIDDTTILDKAIRAGKAGQLQVA